MMRSTTPAESDSILASVHDAGIDRSELLVLVDDDETVHRLVERLLRRTAMQFLGFTDAQVALDWLRDHRPALLLVDYRMPCMNGLELLQALAGRTSGEGQPVPLPAQRTLLCSAGRTESALGSALAALALPIEQVEKRDLFDRARFLPALGLTAGPD